ncbi:unnamed protein product [Caenorhabditis angaria]|uniref:C2H2-type domain-containing protein n=1 Tax=Caenorhabditis angaria TaxID=860376 RepID=A0A9P1I718_9PELO|nr:unnamed protein product [Caenorhabditis angaria]
MSDDEDEGLLRIAESPSDDASFTPQKPLQELGYDKNSDNIIMLPLVPKKPDEKEKEEGEIDDDDEVSRIDEEIEEIPETTTKQCFDMPIIHVPPLKFQEKSVVEVEKHHENTNEQQNSHQNSTTTNLVQNRKRNHHRDSSSSSSNDEKRAKNHQSQITVANETPRSKRTSHQVASAAITACFDEEDMVLPQNSGYLVEKKEIVAGNMGVGNTGMGNSSKRPKKDASTNCCEKNEDTSDINEKLSIFDAPPGTTMVIEITVMYRCNEHLAFRTKGKENAEIYGILSEAGSRMHMGLAAKRKQAGNLENGNHSNHSNSTENHLKVEKDKVRGNSQTREHKNEHKRNKDKKKHVSPKDEQSSVGSAENEHFPTDNLKLVEIDTEKMHDCHFDGCSKRFFLASELNYHVTKFHRRKVIMTDTIACQTAESSFDLPPPPPPIPAPIPIAVAPIISVPTAAAQIPVSIQNIPPLAPQTMEQITPMPVLRSAKSPHYSDLSDDDDEIVKNVIEKNAQVKKQQPLQVPIQPIPQTSLQSLNPSLSLTPNLTNNPPTGFQKNNIVTPAAIRSNSAFVMASGKQPSRPQSSQIHPIPSSSSTSSLPTSSMVQPVPLAAPVPGNIPFIPGFHPAMLHPGMMSQFQPGTSQKPSQDNHKIHELAGGNSAGKEQRLTGGGRNSLGGAKISTTPATPQQQTNRGIPQQQAQQQQFLTPSQAAQQQQQYMQNMQFQQQMMAATRGIQLPTQNDMLMFSMINPMAFQQLASQTQNLPQQPPK